jgi:deoxyribodipyrimidine photo-lyase
MNGMVWLRSDLRMDDNPALSVADSECKKIICLYILCEKEWKIHNNANVKLDFILRNLKNLSEELKKVNIPLVIGSVESFEKIPNTIAKFCSSNNISKCYWNNEFGVDEHSRDENVKSMLKNSELGYQCFDEQILFKPGTLLTGQGKPFSVFTPFKKKWIENFTLDHLEIEPALSLKEPFQIINTINKDISFKKNHIVDMMLWPSGEQAAQDRLKNFLSKKAFHYSKDRNDPILDGTSRISPYLSLGVISNRRCILEALKMNNFELQAGNKGICKWVDEIIWREFYKNIMHSFPRVSMNQPFNMSTKSIQWRHNEDEINAWKSGRTGFPLIDAAMLQLKHEGWMHNRLRMVVAMFFTKNLLHDWRIGEAFFMENLIDGDFASNNGGWQWSASTGTDAAPYFRIFNPVTQSQNFDSEGRFIKKYLPQLASLNDKEIHLPSPENLYQIDYPSQIVDLKSSRLRAIEVFKANK